MLFHCSFDAALGFTLADISSSVVLLFPSADSKFELHKSSLTIQANWHQSQAFGSGFSDERGDVALAEEELARPGIFMRNFFSSMAVAGNKGIGEVELTPVYCDKGSFEARMASFDASYLRAGQNNTSLVVILETVIVASSSVVSDGFVHRQ